MSAGLFLVIAGLWLATQVIAGDALHRLRILP